MTPLYRAVRDHSSTWFVHFDMALVGRGGFLFRWDRDGAARRPLLRSGDLKGLKWIEAPSCYVFHVMNAYDEGDQVVMDVVRHPKMFANEMRGPSEAGPCWRGAGVWIPRRAACRRPCTTIVGWSSRASMTPARAKPIASVILLAPATRCRASAVYKTT